VAWQDVKEQLMDQLANQWNRFTESTFYIQVRERFDNLTPVQQRLAIAGVGLILFLVVFSIPYSYFATSGDEVDRFAGYRQLTRDLLRVTRTQDVKPIEKISAEALIDQIQTELQPLRLQKDQIKKVEKVPDTQMANLRLAPQQIQEDGVQVVLGYLNVRQVVDIASRLSVLGETLKLSGLTIQASDKPNYFDVTMIVSSFSAQAPPKNEKGKSTRKARGSNE
jgi:hypothetical protein